MFVLVKYCAVLQLLSIRHSKRLTKLIIYANNCSTFVVFRKINIMITIISGTNRTGNLTREIVFFYKKILAEMGHEPKVLLLEGLDLNQRTSDLEQIEETILKPTDKYIFILPEYNGSFPGAVKTFIDMCKVPECFYGKKALLTGIADGRAGNLRGMEHFTGILNHMKVIVHPNKLPISVIRKLINEKKELIDEGTQKVIQRQLEEFLDF